MIREATNGALRFRWIVFALAVFYWLYSFTDQDIEKIGWQFRFLTNWALTMSLISAWFMLQRSRGLSENRHEVFASVTVIINIMVVLMYWKIYLEDPTQFYKDGVRTIPLWREYYLHLMGPILQWIDAFLLLGVFKPIKRILLGTAALIISYLTWCELIVRPLNSEPIGTVATGLPYRFLNNMPLDDRLVFYGAYTVGAFVFVAICWVIARFFFPRATD